MARPVHQPIPRRAGFSLVLALLVAATLMLTVIVLAGFIRVESRLASNRQAVLRARLNAQAAMRLAGGALQQFVGPDTRVTAPSSLFDDPAAASGSYTYPVLGVWQSWQGRDHDMGGRYGGRPYKPDYNLKASSNLDGNGTLNSGRFLTWLTSSSFGYYVAPVTPSAPTPPPVVVVPPKPVVTVPVVTVPPPPPPKPVPPPNKPTPPPVNPKPTAPPKVTPAYDGRGASPWRFAAWLPGRVGPAYISPLVGPATTSVPTGRIYLSPNAFPDEPRAGAFAWWVTGENQKALLHPAEVPASPTIEEATRKVKTYGSTDVAALGLVPPAPGTALPSRGSSALVLVATAGKAGFHDYSTCAVGLLTNTANGGLRKDLSLLAETWDWMDEVDPRRDVRLPLFRARPRLSAASAAYADLYYARPKAGEVEGTALGNRGRHTLLYWWSDYGSSGGSTSYNAGTFGALTCIPPVRSWNTLVDYVLQYRKAVVARSASGLVEMAPSQAGSRPLYSYHETVYRQPVVARVQFVFAQAATDSGVLDGTQRRAVFVKPVVTVWNPYNVRLKTRNFSLTLKGNSLPVAFELTPSPAAGAAVPMGAWFDGSWGSLGLALQDPSGVIDLLPGETRVYSAADESAQLDFGTPGSVRLPLAPGYVAGRPGGLYLALDVLPGGNRVSGRMLKLNTGRDAIAADINFPGWTRGTPIRLSFRNADPVNSAYIFSSLYGPDDPKGPELSLDEARSSPRPFGTFSFGLRLANDGVTKTDRGVVSRGTLQSSPFSGYTELGDKSREVLTDLTVATGQVTALGDGIQYQGALHPVNAPFDLYYRPLSGWMDSYAPQVDVAGRGYIVSGLDASTGLARAVVAELPTVPPQSLADLQGWDARGFNPAPPFQFGLIGNSDASPILPAEDVVGRWFDNTGAYRLRTELSPTFLQHDDSFCLNHVLFDDWFVSSLAPDPTAWNRLNATSAGSQVVAELKLAYQKHLAGKPLANSCYQLTPEAAQFAPDSVDAAKFPDAYLRFGAYLSVPGQFNVNSCSVPAWRAVLGHLRDQQVPVAKTPSGDVTLEKARHPLPRMVPSPESAVTAGTPAAALTGFAALTDAQLDQLAVEIVKQVRARGPFLSLAEFVNRRLRLYDGTDTDLALNGALQAALAALERTPALHPAAAAAALGKPTTAPTDARLSPAGYPSDYINPRAAVGNSAQGLPGWPRQADLLRGLAPIISVRDDTFIVRCLGEAPNAEGTARAWCEAVYQRVPEYVDNRIPAYQAPLGDKPDPTKPTLGMANTVLGRRVKLVSFRWLRFDEI